MANSQIYIYRAKESIVFQKNEDAFGALSNMAAGFPLIVNATPIRTTEALYQACRFPNHPDVQREIIGQKSPLAAKYKSRAHLSKTRLDWEHVKVSVMHWCLRVKLAQNWESFGQILLSTGEFPIVEQSKVDPFWGAKPDLSGALTGQNVLGRLLMELRQDLRRDESQALRIVEPLQIERFYLYGKPIEQIRSGEKPITDMEIPKNSQNPQLPLFKI